MSAWQTFREWLFGTEPKPAAPPLPRARGEAAQSAARAWETAEEQRRRDDFDQLAARLHHPAGSARPVQRPTPPVRETRRGDRVDPPTSSYIGVPGYGYGHPLIAGDYGSSPSPAADSPTTCTPSDPSPVGPTDSPSFTSDGGYCG